MDNTQLEVLKALIGSEGLYPDQEGALNEQMAYAQALRGGGEQERHTTGLGALFGGVAKGLNAYRGERDTHDLMAKRDALYKEKAGKMQDFLSLLSSHGQGQQAPYYAAAPRPGDPQAPQPPQQWAPPTFG